MQALYQAMDISKNLGSWFNLKMCKVYRFHYKDKTVSQPTHFYDVKKMAIFSQYLMTTKHYKGEMCA